MSFTSYAQVRGYNPTQIPSDRIIQNFLNSRKFEASQLEANFKLQQEFAESVFKMQNHADSRKIENLRENEAWQQKESVRMKDALTRNFELSRKNFAKANPTSKAALSEKLGGLVEFAPKILDSFVEYRQKVNQDDYKQGLSLIDQLGTTPTQIAKLRELEDDLWESDRGIQVSAQSIIPNATEQELNEIRHATGWTRYGHVVSGLNNSIPGYQQEILNNYSTPYPLGDTDLSLEQARATGNVAAANQILSQMQADYADNQFEALGVHGPNEALASEYFDKLDKVSDGIYNDIWKQAELQAQQASVNESRLRTINALQGGGIHNWMGEIVEGYRDPDNKNWRRNAIHENFPYVIEYLKLSDVPVSEAEDMLSATREDGKTPLLGLLNRNKIREVLAEKEESVDKVRENMVQARKIALDMEKITISNMIRDEGMNNAAIEELWQQYKGTPELREYIQSFITDPVSPQQDRIESARLEYAGTQGELTTEMVLQSKTNEVTKLTFLGDDRIDKPYPEQAKNLRNDISNVLLGRMNIQSFEDLGAKEPSVRMATDDIHQQAMQRFTANMREATMTEKQAYEDALGHGKALIEELEVNKFELNDPSSGFIKGYSVDPNSKPISARSRQERRDLMDQDTYFYRNTPLDTKQDYEFLRQKLLSGGNYDATVEDKFPWVRDVVGLYNGRVTREDILQENAKTLGVNLVFPKAIQAERSNLRPGTLRQIRTNSRELNSYMSQTGTALLEIGDKDEGGWRNTNTYGSHLRRVYDVGSIGRNSSGPHLHIQRRGGENIDRHDFDTWIFADDPELGRIPIGQTPTTDDQQAHWDRGSDGWDFGLFEGTDILVGNGAKIIEVVQTSTEGEMLVIELPIDSDGDGENDIVELLHGKVIRQ